jgi:hypothetical protein
MDSGSERIVAIHRKRIEGAELCLLIVLAIDDDPRWADDGVINFKQMLSVS